MKKFIQLLLSAIVIIAFFVLIPLSTTIFGTFNESFFIDSFRDANVYQHLPELTSEQLSAIVVLQIEQGVKDQIGADVVVGEDLKMAIQEVVEPSLVTLLPEDLIQKTVENNLTYIFQYLRAELPEPLLFIPTDEFLRNLSDNLPSIVSDVRTTITNYDTCDQKQLNRISTSTVSIEINCIPAQVKQIILDDDRFDTVSENIDQIITELKSNNNLLQKGDTITLNEYVSSLDQNAKQDMEELQNGITQSRGRLRQIKVVITFLWILSLSLLAITLITHKTWRGRLVNAGIILLLGSFFWTSAGLGFATVGTENIDAEVHRAFVESESAVAGPVGEQLFKIVTIFTVNYFSILFYISIIFTILGLAALIFGLIIKHPEEENPRTKKEGSSKELAVDKKGKEESK